MANTTNITYGSNFTNDTYPSTGYVAASGTTTDSTSLIALAIAIVGMVSNIFLHMKMKHFKACGIESECFNDKSEYPGDRSKKPEDYDTHYDEIEEHYEMDEHYKLDEEIKRLEALKAKKIRPLQLKAKEFDIDEIFPGHLVNGHSVKAAVKATVKASVTAAVKAASVSDIFIDSIEV